jgi:hypothetical protein
MLFKGAYLQYFGNVNAILVMRLLVVFFRASPRHGPEQLSASGAARDHDALAASRDGWRLVNEVGEVVAVDFCS